MHGRDGGQGMHGGGEVQGPPRGKVVGGVRRRRAHTAAAWQLALW